MSSGGRSSSKPFRYRLSIKGRTSLTPQFFGRHTVLASNTGVLQTRLVLITMTNHEGFTAADAAALQAHEEIAYLLCVEQGRIEF